MTIRITIHSLVRITVTQRPSRLGRWLLGRQETVREATRLGRPGSWVPAYYWLYTDDNREVEPAVLRAIEHALETR